MHYLDNTLRKHYFYTQEREQNDYSLHISESTRNLYILVYKICAFSLREACGAVYKAMTNAVFALHEDCGQCTARAQCPWIQRM